MVQWEKYYPFAGLSFWCVFHWWELWEQWQHLSCSLAVGYGRGCYETAKLKQLEMDMNPWLQHFTTNLYLSLGWLHSKGNDICKWPIFIFKLASFTSFIAFRKPTFFSQVSSLRKTWFFFDIIVVMIDFISSFMTLFWSKCRYAIIWLP